MSTQKISRGNGRLEAFLWQRLKDTRFDKAILNAAFQALAPDVEVRIRFDDREELLEASKRLVTAFDQAHMLDMPKTLAWFQTDKTPEDPLGQIELLNNSSIQLIYEPLRPPKKEG